jgi:hypothetical protein
MFLPGRKHLSQCALQVSAHGFCKYAMNQQSTVLQFSIANFVMQCCSLVDKMIHGDGRIVASNLPNIKLFLIFEASKMVQRLSAWSSPSRSDCSQIPKPQPIDPRSQDSKRTQTDPARTSKGWEDERALPYRS